MSTDPPVSRTAPLARGTPRAVAGTALAVMVMLTIAGSLWPGMTTTAPAVLAWLAAAALWPRVSGQQRVQSAVLIGVGVSCLAFASARGVAIDAARVFTQNQVIISMIAAVSLLRLLNRPPSAEEPPLAEGRAAYVRTMLGVHFFAAFINISALVIMADRLSRRRGLGEVEAQVLVRAFTMAVFYSPFIGGMALALAYTPGSYLPTIMGVGVPLALSGLALLTLFARMGWVRGVDECRGYPAHFESLVLPAGLGLAVLCVHVLVPAFSVLALITMLAPLIVCLTLWVQRRRKAPRALRRFVCERLPDMVGELVLFLGAGVLAAGLVALSDSLGGWSPFAVLDAGSASLVLLVTLALAVAGIHPVIVVSSAAPILMPVAPDPNLAAMLFVMGWGIGCAACPLSGTNLVVHGRYGVSNWRLARSNFAFCSLMTGLAIGFLHLYEWVRAAL